MKNVFKSPSTGQTSSKRVLSLAFGAAAIIGFFCFIYSSNIAEERRQGVSNIIVTFIMASAGLQGLAINQFEKTKKDN